MRLASDAIAAGHRLDLHESLGSTNDEAMALARGGASGPRWIVARTQTKGRGRHGRGWASPPGNLYASLLLIDPCAPAEAPQLGFVAGVALHEAVRLIAPERAEALKLKWPNDLLIDKAKLAGILVEGTSLPGPGPLALAIGIGVNVTSHPSDTLYPAADLASQGVAAEAEAIFEALSAAMARELALWRRVAGFAAIRARWLARAGGLGEPIVVKRAEGPRAGLFRDLDPQGRLLLEEQTGLVAIDAGDVFPVASIERSA